MDLSTTYLGLKLEHPLVMGASPLVDDLDTVRKVEDAGAAAIVMHSLFEEQILLEAQGTEAALDAHENAFAEALDYFPDRGEYALGPVEYLEQVRKIKAAVKIPVIGSLNGTSNAGWLDYAKQIEQAGADALELNVYQLVTDPQETAQTVEDRTVEMLRTVKGQVKIPVALKLSPFYTAPASFAKRLDEAGADGLVLFNRFYQPDIDLEALDVEHKLELSTSSELLLRLRWLAIISPQVKASLACSGGVHSGDDALKAVMAGAHAVQAVSAVLKNGPGWFSRTRDQMVQWLTEHEYESLGQGQGSMNLQRSPQPALYERGNYMKVLRAFAATIGH